MTHTLHRLSPHRMACWCTVSTLTASSGTMPRGSARTLWWGRWTLCFPWCTWNPRWTTSPTRTITRVHCTKRRPGQAYSPPPVSADWLVISVTEKKFQYNRIYENLPGYQCYEKKKFQYNRIYENLPGYQCYEKKKFQYNRIYENLPGYQCYEKKKFQYNRIYENLPGYQCYEKKKFQYNRIYENLPGYECYGEKISITEFVQNSRIFISYSKFQN